MKIEPDIFKYRELKLRLLNAAHSFSSGFALFNDLPTVYVAMKNQNFHNFISSLLEEIKSCLTTDFDESL
ncbi:MAG: hypothetical protein R2771_02215 [Saprospiraceae bacterium]